MVSVAKSRSSDLQNKYSKDSADLPLFISSSQLLDFEWRHGPLRNEAIRNGQKKATFRRSTTTPRPMLPPPTTASPPPSADCVAADDPRCETASDDAEIAGRGFASASASPAPSILIPARPRSSPSAAYQRSTRRPPTSAVADITISPTF